MDLLSNLLLVAFVGAAVTLPSPFKSAAVCNTEECQQVAEYIRANIDEDADPCDDFYKFACGKFKDSHPLSGGERIIDSLFLVQRQLYDRQLELLDDPTLKNHGSKTIRKVKEIYDDCKANQGSIKPTIPETVRFIVNESDSLVPEGMYDAKSFLMSSVDVCQQEIQRKYFYLFLRLYLDKYFSIAEYNASRNVIMNVWKVFRNDIVKSIPWIDEKTKKNLTDNLDILKLNTGCPDWLFDDEELDKEYEGQKHAGWPMNPLSVNANFNRGVPEIGEYELGECVDANRVMLLYFSTVIPAGILQRQIFNRNYPNYINYGAGAFIAAHEINHGFDHWTKSNRGTGKEKVNQCIVNQLETIKEPQTGKAYSNGKSISPQMLPDIGAINATYTAYKKNTLGPEQQLPGLTKYTADQLFFLAQANVSFIQCLSTT